MHDSPLSILIAGAGPTGLSAAIELTRLGVPVRILEKETSRSGLSRALGINARSLELLEESGVTERLLERARKVYGISFRQGKELLWRVEFSRVNHQYRFILVYPQHSTEETLEERLNQLGISVERGVALETFKDEGEFVSVQLSNGETGNYRYLFGADGSHSTVRHQLELNFSGHRETHPWSLADVKLAWNLDEPDANVIFLPSGMVFIMRISGDVYRIAADRPEVLEQLPKEVSVGEILWQTDFFVSHRLVERYSVGRIFLGGDAAHLHSPLGGRGMNLGIEDAIRFARRCNEGTLPEYAAERLAAGKRTVKLVSRITSIATAKNPVLRALRTHFLPHLFRLPLINSRIATAMSGL
ncbi:MAG: FAD-dependent monooxygenase [Bdellovibrionales bacterium]|nr:FAD-dependent monooxygenase [Bdellovibrionales bacterium]